MNNHELLSALLLTVQSRQVEIRSILDTLLGSSLRNTLLTQLKEYDAKETEILSTAQQRGWEVRGLDPLKRFLKDRITRLRLYRNHSDSKIAEIMIQSNTKSLIQCFKNLHQYNGQDAHVCILTQKILDCETAHIRQFQRYL